MPTHNKKGKAIMRPIPTTRARILLFLCLRMLVSNHLFGLPFVTKRKKKWSHQPIRYFGVRSPTGYSWYNFVPSSYLRCAAQGLIDNDIDEKRSWEVFAAMVW